MLYYFDKNTYDFVANMVDHGDYFTLIYNERFVEKGRVTLFGFRFEINLYFGFAKPDSFMARKPIPFFIILFLFGCNADSGQLEENAAQTVSTEKLWTEKERQLILDELDRTTKELLKEVENLGMDQWTFREDPDRWSIAEIVEHLTVQNELHYRELSVASNAPSLPQYLPITKDQDGHFTQYATDPTRGQAKWFLQPLGRFDSHRQSISAFRRARDGVRGFAEKTEVDLRQHFTFRNQAGNKPLNEIKIGDVMDLHQLLLTGIAHTDRHLTQIKNIKKHKLYPRNT